MSVPDRFRGRVLRLSLRFTANAVDLDFLGGVCQDDPGVGCRQVTVSMAILSGGGGLVVRIPTVVAPRAFHHHLLNPTLDDIRRLL